MCSSMCMQSFSPHHPSARGCTWTVGEKTHSSHAVLTSCCSASHDLSCSTLSRTSMRADARILNTDGGPKRCKGCTASTPGTWDDAPRSANAKECNCRVTPVSCTTPPACQGHGQRHLSDPLSPSPSHAHDGMHPSLKMHVTRASGGLE